MCHCYYLPSFSQLTKIIVILTLFLFNDIIIDNNAVLDSSIISFANAQRPTRPTRPIPTTTTTYTPPPPKPTPYIFKIELYIDQNDPYMRAGIKINIENWVKTKFEVQKYDAVVVDQPTVTPVGKLFQYIIKFHYENGNDLPRPTVEAATIMNAYQIFPDIFNVSKFWYDDTLIPPPPPPPHVKVTLIPQDPKVKYSGLVTVEIEGVLEKGTVCKKKITQSAFKYFCDRAGFADSDPQEFTSSDTTPTQEGMPVNWVNLNCDSALNIDRCTHDSVHDTRSDCIHTDDVYVNCYKGSKPPSVTTIWNAALNPSIYKDVSAAKKQFTVRLVSFLNIGQKDVFVGDVGLDLKTTFKFLDNPNIDPASADSYLGSWNYEATYLNMYLGLASKLTSNSTPFTPPKTSVTGYDLSLALGYRGLINLVPTTGSAARTPGTVGGNNHSDKGVAFTICNFLPNHELGTFGIIRNMPGGRGPVYFTDLTCSIGDNFDSCSKHTVKGSVPHNRDLGVVCSAYAPPPPSEDANKWVAIFDFVVTNGFTVEDLKREMESRMTINVSRFVVTKFTSATASEDGKLTFYFTDQESSDTPRVDLEYFIIFTSPSTWLNVRNVTFGYGEPPIFRPTNTTGWEWSLAQETPNATRGLLKVKPVGQSGFGMVCGDKFDHNAAVAVCLTLTGNVNDLNYVYYDEDNTNSGPIYAGGFDCPSYGKSVSSCQLKYDQAGNYPCQHISDVYLDCRGTHENYTGQVKFTVVVKKTDVKALIPGLKTITGADPDRFLVRTISLYQKYIFLEVSVPLKRGERLKTATINSILLNPDAIKLFTVAKVYEIFNSIVTPSADYDITQPPSFFFSPVKYPAMDLDIGGVGLLRVYGGDNGRRGTTCGKGLTITLQNIEAFKKAAVGLCNKFNFQSTDNSRLILNFLPGDDVIFLSNLSASDDPPYLNGVISRAYEKKNDCTHMDDVGIMCGTNLRPPSPTGPMMFTATVRTAVSDEVFTTCVLQKLLGIPGSGNMSGGIAINGTHSYPDGTKGFDYTLLNDDDAIAMTMINTYQMDQLCSIKHFVVSKPYGSLTIAPTSATSAPPSGGGSGKSSSSLPIIIGIIIAVVVVAAVIGGVVFYLKKRAAAAESSEGEEGGKGGDYTLSQPMNEVPEVEDGKDGDDM